MSFWDANRELTLTAKCAMKCARFAKENVHLALWSLRFCGE